MVLPAPCNGGEVYLAAILDELRAINAKLAPTFVNVTTSADKGSETELREPAPPLSNKKRR